jgi:hypothetical protein
MTVTSHQTTAVSGKSAIAETVSVWTAAPLTGSAEAARRERDHRRYAWMYEDEDIWGTEVADCVPPSTYGYDWHAPRM